MLQTADLTIKLNPADDVVIARLDISAGTELIKEGVRVAVNVPAGHKIAVRDIAEGQPVRRYNQVIGYSTKPIRSGEHVHVHNLGMAHFERDYAYGADYKPTEFVPNPATFMGIKRPDGRVATRNYVAIIASVNCSSHVSRQIANYFTGDRMADYPNIDGVFAISHQTGCGMASHGEPVEVLRRVLAGYATHPNVHSALMIGLGFIKRKRIGIHKAFMLSALGISTLFLISYLTAHKFLGSTPYQGGLRPLYLAILLSHTVLAAVIVPLAGITVYQAFSGQFDRHRGWAKWTFPLWLYVSVTGVVIYFMLY